MQLGLYEAFLTGTTQLYEALDFDLALLSSEYVALGETRGFPRSRLAQTRAARGVQEVIPLYVGFYSWRNPDTEVTARLKALTIRAAPQPSRHTPSWSTAPPMVPGGGSGAEV